MVAGIGIDHQALLVAGNDLELFGFVVEQPPVDADDVLDERNLGVEARFPLGRPDQGAELADQHDGLRIDSVEGLGQQQDHRCREHQQADGTVAHRVPPWLGAGGGWRGGGGAGVP